MLHFTRRLIERYRSSPEMGWGQFTLIEQDAPAVLAHSLAGAEGHMIALHNFSGNSVSVTIQVPDADEHDVLVDLLVDSQVVELDEKGATTMQLDGYGYRWYRVIRPSGKRLG
jgi:glycosidase